MQTVHQVKYDGIHCIFNTFTDSSIELCTWLRTPHCVYMCSLALTHPPNEETCWNAHKFSNQSTGEPSICHWNRVLAQLQPNRFTTPTMLPHTDKHTASGTVDLQSVAVSQFISAIWLRPMLRWCCEKEPNTSSRVKSDFLLDMLDVCLSCSKRNQRHNALRREE